MKYRDYTIPGLYTDITISTRPDSDDDYAVIREIFNLNIYRFEGNFLGQKNPVVLDVGANIGVFTLFVLSVAHQAGKAVHVYAIEPEENNIEILRKNLLANKQLFERGSKVTVIPKGVSDFSGYSGITNNAGSSRLTGAANTQEIEIITYDELLEEVGENKIDFVKCDIEGSELPMITGASEASILRARRYAIEFDEHNNSEDFISIIKPFLNDFSFSTFGVPERGCNIYLENHK